MASLRAFYDSVMIRGRSGGIARRGTASQGGIRLCACPIYPHGSVDYRDGAYYASFTIKLCKAFKVTVKLNSSPSGVKSQGISASAKGS